MPKSARLKINGAGGVPVEVIRDLLNDLEFAYNALVLFETILPLEDEDRLAQRAFLWRHGAPFWSGALWVPTDEHIASAVPTAERLILRAVRLESPGFWEFLGALSPLETLRKYLNDRHSREKDRDRSAAELRKLDLENERAATDLVAEQIKLGREMGFSNRELAPLFNRLVRGPLKLVGEHQDRGVITDASVLPLERPKADDNLA
jgi:hypothetical protein